jgi:tetraacyldisaccharide 4'-kinase
MREPAFWRNPEARAGRLLAPLGLIYGAVAARRMARPGQDAGVQVICIGNLTAGGAGKTPTAMAVAHWLKEAGRNPYVLSRGYGGQLAGPVRVDPSHHRAADVGDEPLLIARSMPVTVARDRFAGALAARAGGADVIVMDDGFQNPSLRKDLSLLVVDGRRGVGNGRVFPAGPLRAPLGAQLARADALLVLGEPMNIGPITAAGPDLPVFHGHLEPDPQTVAALRGRKVLAFAGIGYPDKFFATLSEAGIDVRARHPFADHHRYTATEAAVLLAQARRDDLLPVTTEKDLARLAGDDSVAALAAAARSLPVTLVVDEKDALRELVLQRAG